MPGVHPSSRHAPFKKMAEAQNGVDALTTQQQGGITAPVPGEALQNANANQVIASGLIPSSPAGTPGGDAPAYGYRFYDATGTLRVQIDQYGWHLYNASGDYTGELIAY